MLVLLTSKLCNIPSYERRRGMLGWQLLASLDHLFKKKKQEMFDLSKLCQLFIVEVYIFTSLLTLATIW